jgi:hypothetical protein
MQVHGDAAPFLFLRRQHEVGLGRERGQGNSHDRRPARVTNAAPAWSLRQYPGFAGWRGVAQRLLGTAVGIGIAHGLSFLPGRAQGAGLHIAAQYLRQENLADRHGATAPPENYQ